MFYQSHQINVQEHSLDFLRIESQNTVYHIHSMFPSRKLYTIHQRKHRTVVNNLDDPNQYLPFVHNIHLDNITHVKHGNQLPTIINHFHNHTLV